MTIIMVDDNENGEKNKFKKHEIISNLLLLNFVFQFYFFLILFYFD